MSGWVDALSAAAGRGAPAVLVTVAGAVGSVPRDPGARMVVTREGVSGTIGGGALELTATGLAREMLEGSPRCRLERIPLGAGVGQCCGGAVKLLFEPVNGRPAWLESLARLRGAGQGGVRVTAVDAAPGEDKLLVTAGAREGSLGSAALDEEAARQAHAMLAGGDAPRLEELAGVRVFLDPVGCEDFRVVLFGAGHVGRALAQVLATLPCRLTWVDRRADQFPAALPPGIEVLCAADPLAAVARAEPGAFFLVMTHSHGLDEQIVARVLERGDFAYLGLIGSSTKRRRFERRLLERGSDPARLARMTCPIGIESVAGKHPGMIAVATAAQLLQVHAARSARRTESALVRAA